MVQLCMSRKFQGKLNVLDQRKKMRRLPEEEEAKRKLDYALNQSSGSEVKGTFPCYYETEGIATSSRALL